MDNNEFESLDKVKNLSQIIRDEKQKQDKEAKDFFENLSQDDQLKAFYHICRIIWLGEIIERRTYRGVLYEMFNFGPEAYSLGMDCGYFDIHNELGLSCDINESLDQIFEYLDLNLNQEQISKCRHIVRYGWDKKK
jgi:hypothetical protein